VHRKYIPIYIQQDAKLHSLFISGNCSTCAPDDGWKYHPKHVEQFPYINKLCNFASCWIYIRILLAAHHILHISRMRVKCFAKFLYYFPISANKAHSIPIVSALDDEYKIITFIYLLMYLTLILILLVLFFIVHYVLFTTSSSSPLGPIFLLRTAFPHTPNQ
jgi:hypothetical protein